MIESSTYTASYRAPADDRTAGYMPDLTAGKEADATHFSKLVDQAAQSGDTQKTSATADASEKSSQHFTFLDFIKGLIDIINPLQHIPVISTIYRHITGDEISPFARVAGDALYGGPIGAAVGVADVAVEGTTGKDIGENVMAMVTHDKGGKTAPDTQVANANTPAPEQVAANEPVYKLSNIVWDTPAVADSGAENAKLALLVPRMPGASSDANAIPTSPGPAPTKLSYRTGSSGIEPSANSYKEGEVHTMEAVTVPTGSKPSRGMVNVKSVLHSQEAPADTGQNRTVPPELIAQKMMAGLDQYAAMQNKQMLSGNYSAF